MNALIATICVLSVCIRPSIAAGHQAQDSPPPSTAPAAPQQPPVAARIAELKKSLAESKASLKEYEWIETTVVMMNGEEKSRTQQRCYYGADGKIQKIDLDPPDEPTPGRGLRGRIVAKKKAELTEYMKQAVQLVRKYVPPEQDAIEKVKEAGNVSIAILEPGKRIRLDLTNYLVPGDSLKAEMTLPDTRLASISISSFLDDDNGQSEHKDPVTLEVRLGSLEDGTTYAEETVLEAEAKSLKVVVSNSGYRKIDKPQVP